MTIMYCDITGDEIANGTTSPAWRARNRRYYQLMGRDMSNNGLQKLEDEVRDVMSKKSKFSFTDYKATLKEKLEQLTE